MTDDDIVNMLDFASEIDSKGAREFLWESFGAVRAFPHVPTYHITSEAGIPWNFRTEIRTGNLRVCAVKPSWWVTWKDRRNEVLEFLFHVKQKSSEGSLGKIGKESD